MPVGFAGGATVEVAVEAFRHRQGTRDRDRVSHTEDEIVVPRETDDDEIPWDVIRWLTDRVFAAHLDAAALASARGTGQRIREPREGRGPRVGDPAARSGPAPRARSRLEQGDHDGYLPELRRVVEGMGYGMKALARSEVGAPAAAASPA